MNSFKKSVVNSDKHDHPQTKFVENLVQHTRELLSCSSALLDWNPFLHPNRLLTTINIITKLKVYF